MSCINDTPVDQKLVKRSTEMDSEPIPEHESPVRRMMADAHGTPFQPLRTLDEARGYDDGVVILQGDWGVKSTRSFLRQ